MAQHPTEEILNITRKFLGGEIGTPGEAPGRFEGARQARGAAQSARDSLIPPPQRDIQGLAQSLQGRVGGIRNRLSRTPQRTLPFQAADIARERAFGQQGRLQRNDPEAIAPIIQPDERLASLGRSSFRGDTLSDRFFNLPSPVSFARTPQGQQLLQRILQLRGLR